MKVYVLASSHNRSFAMRLLEGTDNVKVISNTKEEKSEAICRAVKSKMSIADAILVLLDSSFMNNLALSVEFQIALLMNERKETLLIPILLDDALLPSDLAGMIYLKCNTEIEEDIKQTQTLIAQVLKNARINSAKRPTHLEREKTSSMIFLSVFIALFSVFISLLLIVYPSSDIVGYDSFLGIITILSVPFALSSLLVSFVSIMKRRHNEDATDEIESYSRRLQSAISSPSKNKSEKPNSVSNDCNQQVDALGRMLINLEDIKEFYTWSQSQAKAAFILAIVTCVLGFVLIGLAVAIPLSFKLSMDLSLIPAIGGVITELIAGTALIVYKSSLTQLNHYHMALHEDERFLSSVNLIGHFSNNEIRDEMLREIIRSEIQMNLESIKDNTKAK